MRWFRFAILITSAAVLQAGFLARWNIRPDLLLILLVFFAVHSGTTEAIITSFVIGFAADLIGSSMGPQIISFGLFGTLLAYLHRLITIRKMPYQTAAIFTVGLFAIHYLLKWRTDALYYQRRSPITTHRRNPSHRHRWASESVL